MKEVHNILLNAENHKLIIKSKDHLSILRI